MNIKACEDVYGELIREDENFYYFLGKGEFGVTIAKHAYWSFQPERLNDSTREGCESLSSCENKRDESEVVCPPIEEIGHEK